MKHVWLFKSCFLKFILICFFCLYSFVHAYTTPTVIHLELSLSTNKQGFLEGNKRVRIQLISKASTQDAGDIDVSYAQKDFPLIPFTRGFTSLTLDLMADFNGVIQDFSSISNPYFKVYIADSGTDFSDDLYVYIPVPATPYALQARSAERVLSIDPNVIQGSFNQSFIQVSGNFLVTSNGAAAFVVSENKIGVGKIPDSSFLMDVEGSLNAGSIFINGEPLSTVVSPWEHEDDFVYLMNSSVGINVDNINPDYAFQVSGSINANQYYIAGQDLFSYFRSEGLLSWLPVDQTNDFNGLYVENIDNSDFRVGINIPSDEIDKITEVLTVSGAIRLGTTIQLNPLEGTISYQDGRFYGWTHQLGKVDLVGIQSLEEDVSANHLLYWYNEDFVSNSSLTVSPNVGWLGINATVPSSQLHIVSDGVSDILRIENAQGNPLLQMNALGNIGIAGGIIDEYKMNINGILNASDIYLDGQPILEALQNTSVMVSDLSQNWEFSDYHDTGGDSAISMYQLYYDWGFVGIGTSSPNVMLELKGQDNVAVVFNQVDGGSYIMGVADDNPTKFILGTYNSISSAFETPLMTFDVENDTKLGIGISDPKASLHVVAQTGFLVEGQENDNNEEINISGIEGSLLLFDVARDGAFAAANRSNWTGSELGNGAVLLGFNGTASGLYSSVVGGENNVAEGNYSLAIGGQGNHAIGNYSVAMGTYAQAANHRSFVWSDAAFAGQSQYTSEDNQFIIRSRGGVGINTNITNGTVLTLQASNDTNSLIKTYNSSNEVVLNLSDEGRLSIGRDNPRAGLDVSGNIIIGSPEFDDLTTPLANQAALSIFQYDQSDDIIHIRNSNNETVFVINAEGNVGIGVENPRFPLEVSGNIYATSYLQDFAGDVVDLMQLLVWQYVPGSDDYSIYFDKGFVGVGTLVPSAQMHLAMTQNETQRIDPLISFSSLNAEESFSMGLILDDRDSDGDASNDSAVFVMVASRNAAMNVSDFEDHSSFLFAVSENSVGMGTIDPTGSLTVSGSTHFSGPVFISNDFENNPFNGIEALPGALYAQDLFVQNLNVNGTLLQFEEGEPWLLSSVEGEDVLHTTFNVLIGYDTIPTNYNSDVMLMVSGSLFAEHISFNHIDELDELSVQTLRFYDQEQNVSFPLEIIINNSVPQLVFNGSNLSSTLQLDGLETQGTGPLAFWADHDSIYKLPVYWNSDDFEFISTASMILQRDIVSDTGDIVSQNITMGFTSPNNSVFKIDSVLNPSMPGEGFSHTAMDINVHLAEAWNVIQTLTGMSLSIDTQGTAASEASLFTDVVGLSVSLNNFEGPQTYAALFNGAPVLIGYQAGDITIDDSNRDTLLFVNGTVSMNTLLANNAAINLEQLQSNGLIVANNIMGVGFENTSQFSPGYQFQVSGNAFITGNVFANELSIANRLAIGDQFLIDNDGAFVIGSTSSPQFSSSYPTATLLISKNIGDASSYVAQKIDVLFDFNAPSFGIADTSDLQDSIALDVDVTGLDLSLNSSSLHRYKGHLKGIVVSMNNLYLDENSQGNIVGLDIDVSKPIDDSVTGNRYAALFNGGPVGIGTLDPVFDLHVSGNIFANLFVSEEIQSDLLTVNTLLVANSISSNMVTVNELFVDRFDVSEMMVEGYGITVNLLGGVITANQLDVSTINILSAMTFSEPVTVNYLTVNRLAYFKEIPLDFIGQLATINALTVSDSLTLSSNAGFAISSGNNDLLFLNAKRLGIGTNTPSASLHIVSSNAVSYELDNPASWSVMKLESDQAAAVGIQFEAADQRSGLVFDSTNSTPAFSFLMDLPSADNPEVLEFQQIMRINQYGVGIGVDNLQADASLQVSGSILVTGSITAENLQTDRLELADSLEIHSILPGVIESYFAVSQNGQISSNVKLNTSPDSTYTMHDLFLNLDLATYTPVNVNSETFADNHVIVNGQYMQRNAVDAVFDSIVGYQLSASELTVGAGTLTGLEIDLSNVNIQNGSAVGLSVNVSSDLLDAGKRYAALFQGRVGIGTDSPETDLHVVGDVSANRFIFNQADFVSINQLAVDYLSVNTLAIYGTENAEFYLNSLIADSVSANQVSVNSLTLANELNVSTLNADFATFNYIGLGYDYDEDYVMKVSGSVFVQGKLFVKDLEVEGMVGTIHFPEIQSQTSQAGSQEWQRLTINQLISDTLYIEQYLSTNRLTFLDFSNEADLSQGELSSSYLDQNFLYFDGTALRFHSSLNTSGLANDYSFFEPFVLNQDTDNPSIAEQGHLLYYDEQGQISPLSSLRYLDEQKTFQFGSSEFPSLNQVQISAALSHSSAPTQGLLLNFTVDDEGGSDPVVYRGLDISFTDNSDENILLASNETAIGLFVDMTAIVDQAGSYDTNRYAAVFNGGNVGINTETPAAVLHISSDSFSSDTMDLFRIDSSTDAAILNVTPKSVLINTTQSFDDQNAVVQIKGNASQALLSIVDHNDNIVMDVSANSVAISPNLIVHGTMVVDTVSVNQQFESSEFTTNFLKVEASTTGFQSDSMISLNYTFSNSLGAAEPEKTFVGLDIALRSDEINADNYSEQLPSFFEGVSELPLGTFYGMRLVLEDMDIIDRKHYSAGFFGAPMMISAISSFDALDSISQQRSVLNIVAPNYLEDPTNPPSLEGNTDSVARFMTLHNTTAQSFHLSGKLTDNNLNYYSFSVYDSNQEQEYGMMSFVVKNTNPFLFLGDLVGNTNYFSQLTSVPAATIVSDNIGLVDGKLSFYQLNDARTELTEKASIGLDGTSLDINLVSTVSDSTNFKISRGDAKEILKLETDSNNLDKIRLNLGQNIELIDDTTFPSASHVDHNGDDTETDLNNSLLYVKGQPDENSNYLATFQSVGTNRGVSIVLDYPVPGNFVTRSETNFMEFWIQELQTDTSLINKRLGRISLSDNNAGVVLYTGGADYAEYLPKRDTSETLSSKQIVGVKDGLISKDTTDAQQLLVMSSTPIVAGNEPQGNHSHYGLVAFLGQVLTNVVGPVNKGDYIVASGNHDGKGFAVAPADIGPEHYSRIVGTAWSSTDSHGDSVVNVAVGSTFSSVPIQNQVNTLAAYRQELNGLTSELSTLEQQIQDALMQQQQLMDRLNADTP